MSEFRYPSPMNENIHSKGFPTDPISERTIGQVSLYAIMKDGFIRIVSYLNPLPVKRIVNTNDEAKIGSAITITSGVSVKIADANLNRIAFSVHTDGDNQAVWIKLQPASIDNDKKGIWVEAKIGALNFWTMPSDNIYTGEISAIANGGNVNVFTTEY